MKSRDDKRTESRKCAKKPNDEGSPKKTYHSPQLSTYGSILEVTQTFGHGALLDTGGKADKSR